MEEVGSQNIPRQTSGVGDQPGEDCARYVDKVGSTIIAELQWHLILLVLEDVIMACMGLCANTDTLHWMCSLAPKSMMWSTQAPQYAVSCAT